MARPLNISQTEIHQYLASKEYVIPEVFRSDFQNAFSLDTAIRYLERTNCWKPLGKKRGTWIRGIPEVDPTILSHRKRLAVNLARFCDNPKCSMGPGRVVLPLRE